MDSNVGMGNSDGLFVIVLAGERCKRGKGGAQAGGVAHSAGWEPSLDEGGVCHTQARV